VLFDIGVALEPVEKEVEVEEDLNYPIYYIKSNNLFNRK